MARPAETTIYDCGICLSMPDDVVHQCRSGHLFCAPCLTSHRESGNANSNKCPTCRVALHANPIRCLLAEHAIAAMPTVCQHCSSHMTRGELTVHLPSCPRRPVQCSAEACQAHVPYEELAAHEQSCVHVTCAALLGQMEGRFRAELKATEERLRNEYRRALVEEHVMTQFRECARHPPGPGFRVELVEPDADMWIAFRAPRAPDPNHFTKHRGFHNRLLCLVPGLEGTIHEGGCYPVVLTYRTNDSVYRTQRESADSGTPSFRMDAPVACFPPYEGPRMETRYTCFPEGRPSRKMAAGTKLAWGEAKPSPEEIAASQDDPAGRPHYSRCSFCHPNVYPSGKICISTLDNEKNWHPSMTAAEILLSIQAYLDEPNFADPAQEEPYHMGKLDMKAYEQRVRDQAARYTSEEFDHLVHAYCVTPPRNASRRPLSNYEVEWTEDGQHRIILGIGG